MKIRNGFVSNSSSSSFIVAFPKKPESVEEAHKMLFGNATVYEDPFPDGQWLGDPGEDGSYKAIIGWDAKVVATRVFNDIISRGEATEEEIKRELENLVHQEYYLEHMDRQDFSYKDMEKESVKKTLKNRVEDLYFRFGRYKKDGWYVVLLGYSDNDGRLDTAMEHGNLFELLPHTTINNH